MKCETCHGTRYVIASRERRETRKPCPDCGGTGVMHCCDGLQEQPSELNFEGIKCNSTE